MHSTGLPVSVRIPSGHEKSLVLTDPLAIVQTLNKLGGQHGVGRIDIVENRFLGLKVKYYLIFVEFTFIKYLSNYQITYPPTLQKWMERNNINEIQCTYFAVSWIVRNAGRNNPPYSPCRSGGLCSR